MKAKVKSNRIDVPGIHYTVEELRLPTTEEGIYKSTDPNDSNYRFIVIKDYNFNEDCILLVDIISGNVNPLHDVSWEDKVFYKVNEKITVDFGEESDDNDQVTKLNFLK